MKEEKEAKRNHLDERHKYLLVTVADCLGLDYSEVEDAILDGTQVCALVVIIGSFLFLFLIFFSGVFRLK